MSGKLPESGQALADYFEQMLQQTSDLPTTRPVVEERPKVLLPMELLQTAGENNAQEPPATAIPVEAEPPLENEPVETDEPASGDSDEPVETDEPESLEMDFPLQCLMFRVGAMLLSVPLVQLGSVVDWSDSITRLPQSPEWLLGLAKHRGSNLRIVDSRCLLNIEPDPAVRPAYLLVLDTGDWAITCDRLEQVVDIDYEDLQRKPPGASPLTLGTIRESLSTLLNPSGIVRELNLRLAPTPDGNPPPGG